MIIYCIRNTQANHLDPVNVVTLRILFIHSGYFCSASSSPLLQYSEALLTTALIGTVSELTRRSSTNRHRQLWVKYLIKVHKWWLEWNSNLLDVRYQTLPLSHHARRPSFHGRWHVKWRDTET